MGGCNCRKRKVTVFRVDYPDGTRKRFLTEAEAKAEKQRVPDAHWRAVQV